MNFGGQRSALSPVLAVRFKSLVRLGRTTIYLISGVIFEGPTFKPAFSGNLRYMYYASQLPIQSLVIEYLPNAPPPHGVFFGLVEGVRIKSHRMYGKRGHGSLVRTLRWEITTRIGGPL